MIKTKYHKNEQERAGGTLDDVDSMFETAAGA